MTTNILLQLLGLFLAIIGMVGLVRTRHFVKIVDEIEHSPFDMFLLSILRTVVGLVFVLGHNAWSGTLEILVSSFGWLILATGIVGLLFPEQVLKHIPAFSKHPMRVRSWLMISFVAGVALAMLGFGLVG